MEELKNIVGLLEGLGIVGVWALGLVLLKGILVHLVWSTMAIIIFSKLFFILREWVTKYAEKVSLAKEETTRNLAKVRAENANIRDFELQIGTLLTQFMSEHGGDAPQTRAEALAKIADMKAELKELRKLRDE
jgi:hypothetical protein